MPLITAMPWTACIGGSPTSRPCMIATAMRSTDKYSLRFVGSFIR
jgi:hypothetical protein